MSAAVSKLDEIAMFVARESKLGNIDDFGCLHDDDDDLSEAEWLLVCEKAEALLPAVVITQEQRIEHALMMSGYGAAAWAQSRAESAYAE
jgi:malic enzyme